MKIRKLGHCCLVIEIGGKREMTDLGSYTVDPQSEEAGIDVVLVTHEHGDHLHVESLKKILERNPEARVVTNAGVGKILDGAGIKCQILPDKTLGNVSCVDLEAHACRHEEIFGELGQVENTGFFIGGRLFYPGDPLYNPGKPVGILALPVAGPWTRARDFMEYVLRIKPRVCFPVYDGMLTSFASSATWVSEKVLPGLGIEFSLLAADAEKEF